ncbi:hypothetical protein WSS15_16740 [Acetobacter pasteurianus]|uniref:hypothetical protein n=1 Tax=Acetobacter pasteurianus TaxID=438 RepID=UPI0022C60A0C|nr:hypothetical protein [Acetobacter pasteurianus]GLH29024.1 hypothetical protein WSS15_16740 [Acetobacter pasteurianus]
MRLETIEEFRALFPEAFRKDGSIILDGTKANSDLIESLPPGLVVNGDLDMRGCQGLKSIQDLRVKGNVTFKGCGSLNHIGPNILVGGSADFSHCNALTSFVADKMVVGENLSLDCCTKLNEVVFDVPGIIPGHLSLSGCRSLKSISRVHVGASLEASDCFSLQHLDNGIKAFSINLIRCHSLQHLPAYISVKRGINISETSIMSLPEGLTIDGWLVARKCNELTSLPEDLYVTKWLSLQDCKNLKKIPDTIDVGDYIDLLGCDNVQISENFLNKNPNKVILPNHFIPTSDETDPEIEAESPEPF